MDNTWTTDQKKKLQKMLNGYGFTDDNGGSLAVDGVFGPKTDAANNDFENNFLEGITGGKSTQKTVQTKTLPTMPKLTDTQILNTVGYKNSNTQNNLKAILTNNFAPANTKLTTDPMASQKNPDGTWKKVAIPGAWAGSGETSLETIASMSKLYQPYAQANKDAEELQDRADDFKRQANACTQKTVEAAEKVRMGLAQPEDEYIGLQQQRKYLQDQADAAQKQADDLRKKSRDLSQQMEKLTAKQTRGMLQESELFDSAAAAAADFAKRAMPLTDKTGHEFAAVMTKVMVPEYKDGKMQMVPKYKYGKITAGKQNNVVGAALTGLLTQTQGEKYLLHTHPNSTDYESDNFSGVPKHSMRNSHDSNSKYNYDKIDVIGDASIPTLAGSQWNSLLNILTSTLSVANNINGYDGIYLAAPSGTLYYYEGLGSGKYHGNTYEDLRDKKNFDVRYDLPKAKGKWDSSEQSYKPGYWVNGQFIEY